MKENLAIFTYIEMATFGTKNFHSVLGVFELTTIEISRSHITQSRQVFSKFGVKHHSKQGKFEMKVFDRSSSSNMSRRLLREFFFEENSTARSRIVRILGAQ